MMLEKKIDVEVRDERFSKIRNMLESMEKRAFEFAQSRSSFQIEKFIAHDEFTPVSMFRHLSHNAHVMTEVLKDLLLDMEKVRRDLETKRTELERSKNPTVLDKLFNKKINRDIDIEVYKLECAMTSMEIKAKGILQELDIFNKLCEELEKKNGKPFTYQDFEDDQPEYWKKRLTSQMHERQIGARFGIGEGNYESYLQAVKDPILPDSKNKIEPLMLEQIDKKLLG